MNRHAIDICIPTGTFRRCMGDQTCAPVGVRGVAPCDSIGQARGYLFESGSGRIADEMEACESTTFLESQLNSSSS
eukprot:351077-Chlamydomonas_euryale.AAC.2